MMPETTQPAHTSFPGISDAVPAKVFAVEWSDTAKQFRISELRAAMVQNFRDWYAGKYTDYRPLACFLSEEIAREFILAIAELRADANASHGRN